LHPHYEQYGKSYYEDVDRAARYISKAITDATADLRAEVERLRRNAIVSHLMQGELETQLATERERVKELEDALQVCWADAHFIKLEWCEEQSPMLAQTLLNIRKHGAKWQRPNPLTTPPSATEECPLCKDSGYTPHHPYCPNRFRKQLAP
jgi:hypothetical protein